MLFERLTRLEMSVAEAPKLSTIVAALDKNPYIEHLTVTVSSAMLGTPPRARATSLPVIQEDQTGSGPVFRRSDRHSRKATPYYKEPPARQTLWLLILLCMDDVGRSSPSWLLQAQTPLLSRLTVEQTRR